MVGKVPPVSPESVRPGGAPRHLGKTFYMAVLGGGWMDVAAGAVGKHAQQISTRGIRFALFVLCKAGAVQLGSFAASRALTSLFRLTPSSAARSASAR